MRNKCETDLSILSYKNIHYNKYWKKADVNTEKHHTIIYKTIKQFEPKTILEVGCGDGRNLRAIQKVDKNIKCFGVDLSSEGISFARLNTNGSFTVCDARKLPFSDNSFDVVFTCHALEQMKYILSDVSKEIYRVTKNYIVSFEPFFFIQNIIGKWCNIRAEYSQGIPFFLEDAGFKIIELKELEKQTISGITNKTGLLIGKKDEMS